MVPSRPSRVLPARWPPADESADSTVAAACSSAPGHLQPLDHGVLTPTGGPQLAGAPGSDGTEIVEIPLGRRVLVTGDLLLGAEATGSSLALTEELARTLERWQGPGLVVVCGNLFGRGQATDARAVDRVFAAHPALEAAWRAFTGHEDRRLIVMPGWRDPEVATGPVTDALATRGAEVRSALELALTTGSGVRRVAIVAGRPAPGAVPGIEPATAGRPWLAGAERLEDPTASTRFVTSRTVYRRLAPFSWLLFLPTLAALALRLSFVVGALDRLLRAAPPRHALSRVYAATWPDRIVVAAGLTAALLVVFALVQMVLSRPVWRVLGGGGLGPTRGARVRDLVADPGTPAELELDGVDALDRARDLIAGGMDGVVVGGTLRSELVHLRQGFFACPGGTTELVREHSGRLGLPPVFVHHAQAGSIELETGADLHTRLLLADVDLPTSTVHERLCAADRVLKGRKPTADVRPAMVAAWPQGASWPPAPEVAADRIRARRVRRLSAVALLAAGVADLLEAVGPPARGHLQLVEQVVSLGGVQAARALVAFAGIALMLLARGMLRGQRRWWVVSVALLSATLVLHILDGAPMGGLVLSALVLGLLVVERSRFGASIDHRSWRSAATTLVVGGATAVVGAVTAVEVGWRHPHSLPSLPEVVTAVIERLVGIQAVTLPEQVNRWVAPGLLGVGVALLLVVAFLGTRPVVDRRLSAGRGASARRLSEARARDIVARHGSGSLDYFALRDDKQWFFHRDSLVAYAVYGGVCLVSPDPIGPDSDRAHTWDAFRRFCDRNGWAVGVVAASEEWLPIFSASGMRYAYVGDEAVVRIQEFTLSGNKMKGLRQACTRLERKGYTVAFFDPARMDPAESAPVLDLVGRHRRGEHERGFSMMLGRLFDPRDVGLLLTVVYAPDGTPAAVCQFVPSRAIAGYSLDLMRRDPAEHPNGLLDFALCSTIEHLKAQGQRGLSLNFAAMRSTLEGESGNGLAQRVERWALRRMSSVLQIESLWRFNAKYDPTWLPRYVVFDSAEQFFPTVLTILRAESLSDLPLVGRLLAPGPDRRTLGPGAPSPEQLPEVVNG